MLPQQMMGMMGQGGIPMGPQVNPMDPWSLMQHMARPVVAGAQLMNMLAQNTTVPVGMNPDAWMTMSPQERAEYRKALPDEFQQPDAPAVQPEGTKTIDPERVRAYLRQREEEKAQRMRAQSQPAPSPYAASPSDDPTPESANANLLFRLRE